MFDSHSTQMFESYDNFRNQLKIFLEKNGVEKTLSDLVDCDIEDVEQITFKFDKNAPLLQILFKAKEFFDDKKVQEFIDVVHEKATQIIKESDTLQKQILEFANLQNQIKQAKVERDAARKITEDTRKENEEMRQILNENMKKMEEYDKNSGADTQFKRAIIESIDSMAKVLNEEVPEMDTDRGILMVYRNYLKAVFEQKCKNCALNMERNKRMTEMMYPIVEKDQDIEKMVSSLVSVTKECQNNLKSRSIEISQINIDLISQRESFNKILALINKKLPNGVEIGEYTYNAVKNNLDEIKRNLDGIVDQKSLAQQEFVADLMKRFKTILETDQTESIESYLFQIENRLRQAEQEHMNYNIFLNNISLRLYTILKKEKKSNPSIEDEVNEAVTEVQNYISDIENTPKQPETVNVTDYSLIAEKLSKILEKDVDKESEESILSAIDDMNDYLNSTRKRFKTASAEASRCKGEMIDIVDKLQNFLNQPSNIPRDLEKIVELADDLIKKLLAQRNELKLADITKMFEPVFPYLHTSSQSDPFSFIPDFVNEFQMVESSVLSLKPFALILNNIFTNFDCQYSSFDPKSHSYNYLKGQVNELHQTLGSMSAAKTHNLIYLVLSRFVTFVSSISSAIAMAYEAKGK
ncbi:hypothetical protein TVAG_583660 [Trichomonas vaginalis G3]|uniref:Uncharacterized protein n=1 Tax=Trichomonas vaginalis (strain ATCC PRA-98 / G3) TaxID=412133 RepID=A2GDG1_TRIV3|nr:WD40 repeat-containing protein [Trichomonas vaginalis G3]EAX84804.1 hypothetical protein TVAG_583660 [Trichomonas vaginalis G3]KAI5497829.1 WD40 repeat-containing protein [Trichomonas vaginalis G3]|eukprot:XP_001297734.1 hypothetical protein [Trichomonas vaginalis G3]